MGENGQGKRPMKVTYVETQHVTADAKSFKSVVQSLTGKNASLTPTEPPINKLPKKPRPSLMVEIPTSWNSSASGNNAGVYNGGGFHGGVAIESFGYGDDRLSIELDFILQGLPLIEELETGSSDVLGIEKPNNAPF